MALLVSKLLVSKLILSAEELAAIGVVAVESTYSEHVVEGIIWDLCRLKEAQGKFLTDRMPLDKKLDLMGDLWKPQLNAHNLAGLTRLIAGLKEANNERNIIIHGYWNQPDSLKRLSLKWLAANVELPPRESPVATKRRLKSDPLQFSAAKIKSTAGHISDLTGKLWDFAADSGIRNW